MLKKFNVFLVALLFGMGGIAITTSTGCEEGAFEEAGEEIDDEIDDATIDD